MTAVPAVEAADMRLPDSLLCTDRPPLGNDRAAGHVASPSQPLPEAGAPLRILTIAACPFPARRGTPVRVERLAEALVARGHEVTVVTYHIGEPMGAPSYGLVRLPGAAPRGDLPPGPSLAKLFLYDPRLLVAVRRQLATRRYDVVHAHHFEGLIIGALTRPGGVPLVYDAHTMLRSELPSYLAPVLRRPVELLARPLDGWLPRLADHVVCAGAGTRDALCQRHGFAPDRVTLAGNGVELGHFAAAARLRAIAPPERQAPRILYTGTLAAYQDVDLLLEAMQRLLERHPDARLVLATHSPLTAIAPIAERLGIVPAIDVVPDDFAGLPNELARATVAVLPRRRCDGVPQKLLNYMAAGCPVVASAGAAQLLEHEATGLVVADGDAAGFAAALARVIEEPAAAAAMGARAHAFIARERSWQATARTVEQVYRTLLADRALEGRRATS